MKEYQQMCGLAVALDYIGDRWTLLIVRELLVAPRTFSQLQDCLKDCSPNLLIGRLREMTRNELVCRNDEGKRGSYRLTDLGLQLRPAVEALVRWGGGFIASTRGLKEKRPHWLEVAVPALLRPKLKAGGRFKIQFMIDDYEFAVSANNFDLDVIRGKSENPELTLNLPYEKLLALLSGDLPLKSLTQDEILSKKHSTKMAAVQRLQEVLA